MAKEPATSAPTEYVVLTEMNGGWRELCRVEARTRREAIREGSVGGGEQRQGLFKAVPVRSWDDTIKVRTEQTVIAHFEDATNGTAPEPEAAKAE